MVVLVAMDCPREDQTCCELFLTKINEMLRDFLSESSDADYKDYSFNPYHLKDDEHGGNKLGIAAVLGEPFLLERTSSCEFHFKKSVDNHMKYVQKTNRNLYKILCCVLT